MRKTYTYFLLLLLIIKADFSLSQDADNQFKDLLLSDKIDQAIEIYTEIEDSNYSFWIAQKYLSLNNVEQAIEWYNKSSIEGNINAKFQLAELLLHYKIDTVKSYNLFKELSILENTFFSAYSKYYLSIFYRYGIGIDRNTELAFSYVKEASNQEFTLATYELIDFYLNGIGTSIDQNKAASLMLSFADSGFTEAEHDYAIMILNEIGIRKDEKTAILWLERAAQKAYPPALQKLSSMYFYGEGVQKNDSKAYEYYLIAKQLGVSDVELDMNMARIKPSDKEIGAENYSDFRPRMNKNSITYLRIPQFMK